MDTQRQRWRGVAQDCARSLARERGPVSFLLGAGASLSSGAPSTREVLQALTDATSGRLKTREVRALVDRIGEKDKQNILKSMFDKIRPHTGYLSLAALGRHRRVVVANLNWDPLISQACAELGVTCEAFDLADRKRWRALNRLPTDSGVVVVHVHGMLGSRSGIATLETLSFTPQEERLLAGLLWANPTVIVGASLVEDTDLEAMFQRLGTKIDARTARWLFARQSDDGPPLPATSMAAEHLSRWPLNCAASNDVDFDELIVTILAEQVGFTYEDLRTLRPTANLPAGDRLVLPAPTLIRDHLRTRTIVLSGEPKLGKTTLAHLLAWWRILWEHPRAAGSSRAHNALGGYEDAATTLAALATQGDDPTAGAATAGKAVLILDDPYGQDSNAANPLFLAQLRRVAQLADGGPGIIVATRELGWHSALRADNVNVQDLARDGLALVSPVVTRWWSTSDLIGLTKRLPQSEELRDAVVNGYLNTPGRILERAWLSSVRRRARPDDTHDAEVVLNKEALIALISQLAQGCALARLQEFCSEPLTESEFEEVLGEPIAAVPGLEQMLVRYAFEEKPRVRLAHPTHREAIDSYLANPGNLEDIATWLANRPLASQPLLDAVRAYRLVCSAIADPGGWTDHPCPPDISEWAPQILAASQNATTISILRRVDWDLWTATELAYELIRLYPAIKNRGGREFIYEMLSNDEACGAYAVLEACLYLRSSASDEVWSALKTRLYDLTARPANREVVRGGAVASQRDRELALAIDGLLWRPPPLEKFSQQFVRAAFEEVSSNEPLWGVLRFASGYHPGGLSMLGIDALVEADQDISLTIDQVEFVAWLIQWHFVHQSRARAILARQPYVDKDFLCRSLHPAPVDGDPHALRRLMTCLLTDRSTAGWVMHLGCNLLSIGVYVDDSCRDLMRDSMTLVGDEDLGVITCALTYTAAAQFSDVLRPYFARPQNREAILDAVGEGPVVDGLRIRPPRFVCARPPKMVQSDLNLIWPRLHRAGFDASDPEGVARVLRGRAELLMSRGDVDGKAVELLLERVRRGDLRILEQAVSARDAPEDLADHLLQVGTFALREPERLF